MISFQAIKKGITKAASTNLPPTNLINIFEKSRPSATFIAIHLGTLFPVKRFPWSESHSSWRCRFQESNNLVLMQCWLSFVHNQFVTEQRILFNCPWQLRVIIFLCLIPSSAGCNRWSHGLTILFKWRWGEVQHKNIFVKFYYTSGGY